MRDVLPMTWAPRDGRAIRIFDWRGRSQVARWFGPADVGVWQLADGWRYPLEPAGWEAI